jgi:hypothetical protein
VISETRERFIRSIAERLAPDRIAEAFFFPSIRQGPMETGVAVIAAWPGDTEASDAAPGDDVTPERSETPPGIGAADAASDRSGRTEVFTATYRWTRKGPERGAWVVDVTTEAHAPLATVETVVRGVQERAGEALDAHRMDGDEFRAVLAGAFPRPAADAVPPMQAAGSGQ